MSGRLAALTAAAALLGGLLAAPSPASGDEFDWPCWRGPRGDGISREEAFLNAWPAEGLRELWRIPLGSGFSSFAAVGDSLYTETERAGKQQVVCLEALTGKERWTYELEDGFKETQGGNGPRATPSVKDAVVYALGARGSIAALDASSGKKVWALNVLEKFQAKNITWGLSASPLVYGDLLIVVVGARGVPVVAFNRFTGEVAWTSGSDGQGDLAGYSTPYAIKHKGTEQILVLLGKSLVSLGPARGRVLWRYYWKTDFNVNAAAPIYDQGRVFISSGYGHGCVLVKVPDKPGGFPRKIWQSKVFKNKFSSCVLHKGHLYGFDDTILTCVRFATGEEVWSRRGFGYGSCLLAGKYLIVLGDKGDLALVRATALRYAEVARAGKVLRGSVAWTVPVLHRGVLYLRNLKEAVALDLRLR